MLTFFPILPAERKVVAFSAVDIASFYFLFRFLNQTDVTATVGTNSRDNEGINHANFITSKLLKKGRLRADSPHCGEEQVTRFAEKGAGIGCIAAKDNVTSSWLTGEKFKITYCDVLSIIIIAGTCKGCKANFSKHVFCFL